MPMGALAEPRLSTQERDDVMVKLKRFCRDSLKIIAEPSFRSKVESAVLREHLLEGDLQGMIVIFEFLPHKQGLEDLDYQLFDLLSKQAASAPVGPSRGAQRVGSVLSWRRD